MSAQPTLETLLARVNNVDKNTLGILANEDTTRALYNKAKQLSLFDRCKFFHEMEQVIARRPEGHKRKEKETKDLLKIHHGFNKRHAFAFLFHADEANLKSTLDSVDSQHKDELIECIEAYEKQTAKNIWRSMGTEMFGWGSMGVLSGGGFVGVGVGITIGSLGAGIAIAAAVVVLALAAVLTHAILKRRQLKQRMDFIRGQLTQQPRAAAAEARTESNQDPQPRRQPRATAAAEADRTQDQAPRQSLQSPRQPRIDESKSRDNPERLLERGGRGDEPTRVNRQDRPRTM